MKTVRHVPIILEGAGRIIQTTGQTVTDFTTDNPDDDKLI